MDDGEAREIAEIVELCAESRAVIKVGDDANAEAAGASVGDGLEDGGAVVCTNDDLVSEVGAAESFEVQGGAEDFETGDGCGRFGCEGEDRRGGRERRSLTGDGW